MIASEYVDETFNRQIFFKDSILSKNVQTIDEIDKEEAENEDLSSFVAETSGNGSKVSKDKSNKTSSGES